jgi:hypothetical protein
MRKPGIQEKGEDFMVSAVRSSEQKLPYDNF